MSITKIQVYSENSIAQRKSEPIAGSIVGEQFELQSDGSAESLSGSTGSKYDKPDSEEETGHKCDSEDVCKSSVKYVQFKSYDIFREELSCVIRLSVSSWFWTLLILFFQFHFSDSPNLATSSLVNILNSSYTLYTMKS